MTSTYRQFIYYTRQFGREPRCAALERLGSKSENAAGVAPPAYDQG